jgi:hypothetical protein
MAHVCLSCWIPKVTNTLRICNTCCFSTVTVVTRTRHSVAFYVHYLSCYTLAACDCHAYEPIGLSDGEDCVLCEVGINYFL